MALSQITDVVQDKCVCLRELLEVERPAYENAVKENKDFLSKKAKHDVGWESAEIDFIKNYFEPWAAGFKAAYCSLLCSARDNCGLCK